MFRRGFAVYGVVRDRLGRVWQTQRGYKTPPIDLSSHPEKSLAAVVPDVLRYWDTKRNGDLDPRSLPYTYRGELWWKCPKGVDHVWKTRYGNAIDAVNHRFRDCPFCSNRKLSVTNSLLTVFPDLAMQFDPLLNGGREANQVIFKEGKRFQWRCPHNHTFGSTIRDMVRNKEMGQVACPVCRREERQSLLLADEYPDLFEESYNWLNCPTLKKPESSQVKSNVMEDILPSVAFEELYTAPSSEKPPTPIPVVSSTAANPLSTSGPTDPANESLNRALQNHIIEYKKWRECLHSDDTAIIWWVCSCNANHIWRESVRSRVRQECPFCKKERCV